MLKGNLEFNLRIEDFNELLELRKQGQEITLEEFIQLKRKKFEEKLKEKPLHFSFPDEYQKKIEYRKLKSNGYNPEDIDIRSWYERKGIDFEETLKSFGFEILPPPTKEEIIDRFQNHETAQHKDGRLTELVKHAVFTQEELENYLKRLDGDKE